MKILFILILNSWLINVYSQGIDTYQVFDTLPASKYNEAIRLILEDKELLKTYCSSPPKGIQVHPNFQYFELSYFKASISKDRSINVLETNKYIQKIDRRFQRKQNRYEYILMPASFYAELNTESSCVIVCFDRIRKNLLTAEVTYANEGTDWSEVRNRQTSHLVMFDFSFTPAKFYKIEVMR